MTTDYDAFVARALQTLEEHSITPRIMIFYCLIEPRKLKSADGTEYMYWAELKGGYDSTLYCRLPSFKKMIKIYRTRRPHMDWAYAASLNRALHDEQNGQGGGTE